MTTTQAERMRRGREAAARARQAREDVELTNFRAWLGDESRALARYQEVREIYGADDERARHAYTDWRAFYAPSKLPTLPPKSAWDREAGEDESSD